MRDETSNTKLPLNNLADYLRSQMGSHVNDLSAREFAGGASNPTYWLDTGDGKYVLRSKPVGKLVSGAHAVDREYRVINALGQTDFPVPEAFFYCDNIDVIGAEFYVMQFIEGRVYEDFTLPDTNPAERAAIYDSMNETIAHLHGIDPDAIGLSDYGRDGNYFERQINLWMRQYQSHDQSIPIFEEVANWLTTNLIADNKRTIVHGDFRLANLIIAPDAPKVAAVLDWELSTLGHPLADFGYNLSQWYLPNFNVDFGKVTLADADVDALGIPQMEAYAESYFARRGEAVSARDLYYSIAFNLYRLSGIIIGVIGRAKSGTAKNAFARSSAHNLEPTIALAAHYAEKADAC